MAAIKKKEPYFRFHDPNSLQKSSEYILKMMLAGNFLKLENAVKAELESTSE